MQIQLKPLLIYASDHNPPPQPPPSLGNPSPSQFLLSGSSPSLIFLEDDNFNVSFSNTSSLSYFLLIPPSPPPITPPNPDLTRGRIICLNSLTCCRHKDTPS